MYGAGRTSDRRRGFADGLVRLPDISVLRITSFFEAQS